MDISITIRPRSGMNGRIEPLAKWLDKNKQISLFAQEGSGDSLHLHGILFNCNMRRDNLKRNLNNLLDLDMEEKKVAIDIKSINNLNNWANYVCKDGDIVINTIGWDKKKISAHQKDYTTLFKIRERLGGKTKLTRNNLLEECIKYYAFNWKKGGHVESIGLTIHKMSQTTKWNTLNFVLSVNEEKLDVWWASVNAEVLSVLNSLNE